MKTFFSNFAILTTILVTLSISPLYAAEKETVWTGGYAHSSGDKYVVVMNIGLAGQVFAGTFIGRTSYYGWDFMVSVYTDAEARLSVVPVIGGEIIVNAENTDLQNCDIKSGTLPLGKMKYDPKTGNFSISNYGGSWFQGHLMGSYIK